MGLPGWGDRGQGRGPRKFGIPLDPILAVLDDSIDQLRRQLPQNANDQKRANALQQSIERLKSVRHLTKEICPNEGRWFGVPKRDDDEDNDHDYDDR